MGDSDSRVSFAHHFVAFAQRYLMASPSFALPVGVARDRREAWRWSRGPSPYFTRRHVGLPGSWRTLVRVPRSRTPAQPTASRHSRRRCGLPPASRCPPAQKDTISGLHHAAHGLAVYASRRRSPDAAQDSLPAGRLTLAGRDRPAGSLQEFRCQFDPLAVHLLLPQASPGARRVAPGGYPPGAPTDPDVRVSRIRLLRQTHSRSVGKRTGRPAYEGADS
jgi:hypothetical protein